jgi:hypothetical protein
LFFHRSRYYYYPVKAVRGIMWDIAGQGILRVSYAI